MHGYIVSMRKSVFRVFIGNNSAPCSKMLWIIYTIRLGENAWVSGVTIGTTNCPIPVWVMFSSNCRTTLIVYIVLKIKHA